jgi:hypothetical protein
MAHFISRTMELRNAALRFFGASLRRPEFRHPTSSDGRSPTRTSPGDFIPTTGGNLLIRIDMSDQNEKLGSLRRRRSKVIGFIIAEASAIGVLLLSGTFALSLRLADPALVLSMNIVTVAAAVAVAMIPIIFFAIAPTLPRRKH